MKSVKPGRGPSAMSAVGSVIAIIFGIIWTVMASQMGAPIFFPLFGVLFIIMGIAQAVYNIKNAVGKNRFSSFDITDSNEEPDPLNQRFYGVSEQEAPSQMMTADDVKFCPYCGTKVDEDFKFCKKCGKKLPD